MPFTNKDFPNQVFKTVRELAEAVEKRERIEQDLLERASEDQVTKVTAIIVPASPGTVERRLIALEQKMEEMVQYLNKCMGEVATINKDNLPIGMLLKGESKGRSFTLEVLDEGYVCSTGEIAATLSSAAEIVSGNRRSGWSFWKDGEGTPIGEVTGRFKKSEFTDPFGAL